MTLELTGLEKAYADFAVGPIDCTVDDEVLSVLGPSGSGKTTLLSLVAGITTPDAGSVTLDGRELVGLPLEARNVGMVFQEGALFPHMTARENVAYAADSESRVAELASLLELEGALDRRPPDLSGGEQQRVALARTLAADPDALLLDEPLSSLDAPIRRRLREDLQDLFATLDIPVLYVTHDQRTAAALGDRLAVVHDGTIEQVGPPTTVIERPASRFVARFTGTENVLDGQVLDQTDGGSRVRAKGMELLTTRTATPGSAVTVCLHPGRIDLGPGDDEGANTLTGTVDRCVNEGADYRVTVDVDGVTLLATARPSTVDRLGVEPGRAVAVRIPPEAVHLLPGER